MLKDESEIVDVIVSQVRVDYTESDKKCISF